MEVTPTGMEGCVVVRSSPFLDERGGLWKLFQRTAFTDLGLEVAECLVSWSHRGVVRGLHLQRPPHTHTKLVVCLTGRVFDVALDVRAGSPTYGRHASVTLAAERPEAMLVPPGCAHGWQALTEPATVLYLISGERVPEAEDGVRWDSAGVDWPVPGATTSDRDAELPALDAFEPLHGGGRP
jgi:dTDP-4-dehydrorhamnose 3,5-epimerase